MRRDDPTVARVFGMIGAACVIFGSVALLLNSASKTTPLGSGWATFILALGLACLLFHATFDWDVQFRRTYMAFGYLCLMAGAFLCLVPWQKVGDKFGLGFALMTLALFFILAFLRNEEDRFQRRVGQGVLGVAGAALAAAGLIGGNVHVNFLIPYGLLAAALGLVYLASFVASRGISDDLAYRAALGMTIAGAVIFLVALVRVFIAAHPIEYLVPAGILLLLLGVAYTVTGYSLFSDRPLVVLTRRELGAFFYSPMAYIILFVSVIAYGYAYFSFTLRLVSSDRGILEPILLPYVIALFPVVFVMLVVPALTMRLLSEERRTGTLEVMLTVPVTEVQVTLSKFLAAFLVFLVTWIPFGLFLVYLRVDGGQPFDYRPLLSFFTALCVTGASFISMGIFFSSLTRSQIGSFLFTAVGMLFMTLVFIAEDFLRAIQMDQSAWMTVLTHVSYLDAWHMTLQGKLVLRNLLFFASMTVLWLFLSVKVLEARKWL
jgi:ABC-type transport system involved in multi-copper enzyme maturation permease subunit